MWARVVLCHDTKGSCDLITAIDLPKCPLSDSLCLRSNYCFPTPLSEHYASISECLDYAWREVPLEVPGCVSLLSFRIGWWRRRHSCMPNQNEQETYLCTNFCHWASQALFWDWRDGSHIAEVMRFFDNDEFCDFVSVVGRH